MKELDELIRLIVKDLKNGNDLKKDYMFIGGHIYSKQDIIDNLLERTEVGMSILKNVILLTCDLISRGKQAI